MINDKLRSLFSLKSEQMSHNDKVQNEQNQSEVLISWTQLCFALFMFSVWVTSIFTRKSAPEYEVIPIVLGLYVAFSIAKIYWSYRLLVNEAILIISIITDVFLVSGLIWVFHIQYEQPPGFYLRAPTFVYYFFFISLRTLRYDAVYVFTIGITSIISWGALLFYALKHKESQITNSFIDYTLGQDILVGAEVEKMIGLFVVTIAMSVAVYRKKALLLKSVEDGQVRESLTKFFSHEVAEAINESSEYLQPGFGKTRYAAILMIDIRGFTPMTGQWSPNQILQLISEYQEVIVPIILKHNGCIDKYMGDGIFAHFGAAAVSSQFACDVMKAMEEIEQGVALWNKERSERGEDAIRIGQASAVGNVVFGTTGEKNRLEFTTIGSAVNIASKIEQYTKVLEVSSLTTLETFKLAEKQGYKASLDLETHEQCQVAGLEAPLDIVVFKNN